jgi:hypothetical protein
LELAAARVPREELENLLEGAQVVEELVEEEPLEVEVP